MSWWVGEAAPEGKLIWERDVWNDSKVMEQWMLLVTYEKHGIEFAQIEEGGI